MSQPSNKTATEICQEQSEARTQEELIALLRKQLDDRTGQVKHLCEDWAHDHTELQNRCRAAGCPEIDVTGDQYGTPGILALVDALVRQRRAPLEAALREILSAQPCLGDGGSCFYPRHDGDGEYVGEQYVDPISVIGAMTGVAARALDR